MTRKIFQRMMEAGETFDKSVSCMYPEHSIAINRALCLLGTAESGKRKFAFRGVNDTAGR
jgi:hypothetical protein